MGYLETLLTQLGMPAWLLGIPEWLLVIIFIWSGIWKLIALWKSARSNSIVWFIIIAITNTIGILPILYIFIFSKKGDKATRISDTKKKSKKKK